MAFPTAWDYHLSFLPEASSGSNSTLTVHHPENLETLEQCPSKLLLAIALAQGSSRNREGHWSLLTFCSLALSWLSACLAFSRPSVVCSQPQNCLQGKSTKLSWPWSPCKLTLFGAVGFNGPSSGQQSKTPWLRMLIEVWEWKHPKREPNSCPMRELHSGTCCIFLFIFHLKTCSAKEPSAS